ncbi:MAG: phytanoyl-CoA dioxygenase family protein [Rhodospirillales bacterium]|nr:phytanoyl-CoA dioxygenase family protein [Rhodospirillales bacterium]
MRRRNRHPPPSHPGQAAQRLHTDNSWPTPLRSLGNLCVNATIALTDDMAENGATLIIPGSHIWNKGEDGRARGHRSDGDAGGHGRDLHRRDHLHRRHKHRDLYPPWPLDLRLRGAGCGRSRTTISTCRPMW